MSNVECQRGWRGIGNIDASWRRYSQWGLALQEGASRKPARLSSAARAADTANGGWKPPWPVVCFWKKRGTNEYLPVPAFSSRASSLLRPLVCMRFYPYLILSKTNKSNDVLYRRLIPRGCFAMSSKQPYSASHLAEPVDGVHRRLVPSMWRTATCPTGVLRECRRAHRKGTGTMSPGGDDVPKEHRDDISCLYGLFGCKGTRKRGKED